jgi:transposase
VQALIGRYDSPAALRRAGKRSLQATLKRGTHGQGVRYTEALWEAAQRSVALAHGQESRVQALRDLLAQLASLEAQQRRLREDLGRWLEQTEEGAFLRSVPGVGVLTAGGLLGECGPLAEFHSARALEKFVGLNLYRISSGKRQGQVHLAKRGRSGVRTLLAQLALAHMRTGGLGRAWAQHRRAQGHPSRKTQMAVARKLLALLYALARDRQYFDATRWSAEAQTTDGDLTTQGTPPLA